MKKALLPLLLALLGFYLAWPAWTGYQIRNAFETQDALLLESKVDFPAVRASLKPIVTAETEASFERIKRDAGPLGGLIAGTIKGEVMGRLVETAINSAITPPNVIRTFHEGRSIKQSLERILVEQAGSGGLKVGGRRAQASGSPVGNNAPGAEADANQAPAGGSVPPATTTSDRRPRLGIANIKSFSISSPLEFSVGVAKDVTATQPEVTATLRFTGTDWKVVAITPDFAARRNNRL